MTLNSFHMQWHFLGTSINYPPVDDTRRVECLNFKVASCRPSCLPGSSTNESKWTSLRAIPTSKRSGAKNSENFQSCLYHFFHTKQTRFWPTIKTDYIEHSIVTVMKVVILDFKDQPRKICVLFSLIQHNRYFLFPPIIYPVTIRPHDPQYPQAETLPLNQAV
jgi:hypothetical protein